MKKMILIVAVLLATLFCANLSIAAETQKNTTLNSFKGNLSEKGLGNLSLMELFGLQPGFFVAEAAKFKAPRADWKITRVSILGWDGFNGSVKSVPSERIIDLEIRDKDSNLLYRFADSQLPYTNFAFNRTGLMFINIDLPSIPVNGEFYICFYDRDAVRLAFETLNQTDNSFIFVNPSKEMVPAEIPTGKNETSPIGWIMEVTGN